ncbi:helix-turn-helix domain-containing protein [Micromonospora sp. NPDC049102]|uniref:helix-turn-helix domain-containing protein n=1 Tax=Micromonospora sp. NPDC049102 TaxID=3364265 RepID=UPI0037245F62
MGEQAGTGEQWRAQFDAQVSFANGGGLRTEGFRLDVPGQEISDDDLAALFVRYLGLLMVAEVDADVGRAVRRRPATLAAHRRLADRAREVLAHSDFTLGLGEVAREVGSSPHHLSRVFQRMTGSSLTAYRNRLRVRAVLDTPAEPDGRPLGALAADYGFADQAHLTRVVREQVGHPPARLRRLLATPGTDPASTA